jgi:REP element-mobilizing transposase RayT
MANTYTQCYFQLVFAVKNREALIHKTWKSELEMFITGIVQNHKHKMLAIFAMPDHLHMLIGYNPNELIPDLVEQVKTSSNSWIKQSGFTKFRFEWQKGYGAFTYSRSEIDDVIKYILSQEQHHSNRTFRDEYKWILELYKTDFKNEYLFDFID